MDRPEWTRIRPLRVRPTAQRAGKAGGYREMTGDGEHSATVTDDKGRPEVRPGPGLGRISSRRAE
jgi:hypothetical protein